MSEREHVAMVVFAVVLALALVGCAIALVEKLDALGLR